jgi:hypothetical protein
MMRGGLVSAALLCALGPALALVALSAFAHSPAAAGPAAKPGSPRVAHVVSAEHFQPPPWCFIHWCPCQWSALAASLRVFPWSVSLGLDACPTPPPTPSPTPTSAPPSPPARPTPPAPPASPTTIIPPSGPAKASPSASPTGASPVATNPAPGGAATFPATVTLTSPPPSQTAAVPAPASPAAPPAVATVPASQPASPQPHPARPGAPAAFPRTQGNLLRPATPARAGLSVRLLMILVLVPCAAAGVLRYGGKR